MASYSNVQRIERVKLGQLFSDLDGKIATVRFQKQNKEMRTMNFRLGVSKGVTGNGKSIANYTNPYVTVYDMQKKAFRNINLNTVTLVRANGVTYTL